MVPRLRVTGKKLGYATTEEFSDLSDFVAAAGTYRTPALELVFVGRLATGTVLSVEPGTWDVGVKLTYQWQRDRKDIAGATSPTYRVRASDVDHRLRVRVTGSVPGFKSVATYSVEDIPAKVKFAASAKPKITGTRAVGKKLTATVDWTPTAKLKYQWYRNGKQIKGATKAGYTLKASDLNDRFSVRVAASKAGYTTTTIKSPGVTIG